MTYRKPGEPSIEACQELALLYIHEMRKKKIEPTIESIVKKYLISEEMAMALLAQESSGTTDYDVFPLTKYRLTHENFNR